MEMPPIRYATARDGTRIAWTRFPGASPPWLHVYSPGVPPMALTPSYRYRISLMEEFGAGRTTVLFDFRGTGLSGPIVRTLTAEDLAQDIAAVCDAVGEPMDVMMMNGGCYPALLHALECQQWRKLLLTLPYRYMRDSFQVFNESLYSVREGLHYWEFCRHVLLTYMGALVEEVDTMADRYVSGVPLDSYVAYARALQLADLATVLPQVTQEIYVSAVANERQRFHAEQVAALNPRISLLYLPNRYHGPETYRRWRELLEGESTVGEAIAEPSGLSARELEVLRLLATGKTNIQIAEALVVSRATVATHVSHILDKTRSANRAEATAYAVRHGLA